MMPARRLPLRGGRSGGSERGTIAKESVCLGRES
jgi:hypothetical protein